MIAIDASVVAGWLLADETNSYTESVAAALEQGAIPLAPSLLMWEVTNLLLTCERRGRVAPGTVPSMLAQLSLLPWKWEHPPTLLKMDQTAALARKHGLTSYDAAYLLVALEHSCPLATQDKALQQAAKAEKVKVYAA